MNQLTQMPNSAATTAVQEPQPTDLPLAQLEQLQEWFGSPFTLVNNETGERQLETEGVLGGDWAVRGELCREVARRGRPEIIQEGDHAMVLAISILPKRNSQSDIGYVAVAAFRQSQSPEDAGYQALAAELGTDPEAAARWAAQATAWSPVALMQMAQMAADRLSDKRRLDFLGRNVQDLSVNVSSTYEEISLLYRLTENQRIADDPSVMAETALNGLTEVVPADAFAVQLLRTTHAMGEGEASLNSILLTEGDCPLDATALESLIDEVGRSATGHPFVYNCQSKESQGWQHDDIRQLVMVPLTTQDRVFGYLMAMNHHDGKEFGTVEASLLSSVASILAIHCSNIELYHEQAELFSGVVRALSSAIDAKDPYTCGHSDRVARVAVRLAEHLGVSAEERSTIYLSGLLHDIGKIGVSDAVLQKPGKLTAEEYEHIKLHPGLGYKILVDIKKIEPVLPGVLHHHEAWNGTGYPKGLAGEQIPFMARILAVADAFDAMGSDRPYRKGMSDELLDSILKDGAGTQWDARVIDAFFEVREEIRAIADSERDALHTEDLQQWN